MPFYRFLPFGIMAGLAVAGAVVSMTLPETYDQPTMEDLVVKETADGQELEKVVNGNVQDSDNTEKSALM